jgi:hypothetical protein
MTIISTLDFSMVLGRCKLLRNMDHIESVLWSRHGATCCVVRNVLKLREKHDLKKKIDFGQHAAVTTPNLNTNTAFDEQCTDLTYTIITALNICIHDKPLSG